jgi:hypothetical protein
MLLDEKLNIRHPLDQTSVLSFVYWLKVSKALGRVEMRSWIASEDAKGVRRYIENDVNWKF